MRTLADSFFKRADYLKSSRAELLGAEVRVGRGGVAEWIGVPAWRTCWIGMCEAPT